MTLIVFLQSSTPKKLAFVSVFPPRIVEDYYKRKRFRATSFFNDDLMDRATTVVITNRHRNDGTCPRNRKGKETSVLSLNVYHGMLTTFVVPFRPYYCILH